MTETEQTQAVAQPMASSTDLIKVEGGKLAPDNFGETWKMAHLYLKSKMLPARFNTAEAIVTGMQYAVELKLPPLTSLRQIAIVQGTPSTFGDLPLSLVMRTGKLEEIDEYWLDAKNAQICTKNNNLNAQAVAAVCRVKRKGDATWCERFFTLDDMAKAGLGNSPTWKGYQKTMMKYRARSQALKDKFPDCLNGIAIAEYDFHVIPTEESPRLQDAAADLNSAFESVDAEVVTENEKTLKL